MSLDGNRGSSGVVASLDDDKDDRVYIETTDKKRYHLPEAHLRKSRYIRELLHDKDQNAISLSIESSYFDWIVKYWNDVEYMVDPPPIVPGLKDFKSMLTPQEHVYLTEVVDALGAVKLGEIIKDTAKMCAFLVHVHRFDIVAIAKKDEDDPRMEINRLRDILCACYILPIRTHVPMTVIDMLGKSSKSIPPAVPRSKPTEVKGDTDESDTQTSSGGKNSSSSGSGSGSDMTDVSTSQSKRSSPSSKPASKKPKPPKRVVAREKKPKKPGRHLHPQDDDDDDASEHDDDDEEENEDSDTMSKKTIKKKKKRTILSDEEDEPTSDAPVLKHHKPRVMCDDDENDDDGDDD